MAVLKSCLTLGLLAAGLSLCAQSPALRLDHEDRSQKVRPNELRIVAERGFRAMVAGFEKEIEPGTLPDGFPLDITDLSELKGATLGMGYQVHTVNPAEVMGGSDLEPLVKGTSIWHFLVMVDARPVAILEVDRIDNAWQVVGVGSAELAKDVHAMATEHARKGEFRFVRIYQATSDLMEVRQADSPEARYVPLVAARQSLRMARPLKASDLLNGQEILPSLQSAVRHQLALVQE